MKPKRFLLFSDVHGDEANPAAMAELYDFARDYKPDVTVCLGDVWDLRALRRGASDNEAAESIEADIDAGLEVLRRLKPSTVLLGNHDDRLWRMAREHPVGMVKSYARQVVGHIEDRLPKGTRVIHYNVENGIARLGDMLLLHGYQCNLNTARAIAHQYGGGEIRRVVQGHVHHFSSHTTRTRQQTIGHTIGALCNRVMEYNKARPATMSHENGWAYGEIINGRSSFNEYHVETKREPIHVIA